MNFNGVQMLRRGSGCLLKSRGRVEDTCQGLIMGYTLWLMVEAAGSRLNSGRPTASSNPKLHPLIAYRRTVVDDLCVCISFVFVRLQSLSLACSV